MALYLVEHHFDGEPVGIWNDAVESYYIKQRSDEEAHGRAVVTGRNPQVPWSVYVEEKSRAVNHRTWWSGLNSLLEMSAALDDAREDFFTTEANRVTEDN